MSIKFYIYIFFLLFVINLFPNNHVIFSRNWKNYFKTQLKFKYNNPFVIEKKKKKNFKLKNKVKNTKKAFFPPVKLVSLSTKAVIFEYDSDFLIVKKGEVFLKDFILIKIGKNYVVITNKKSKAQKKVFLE